MRLRLLAVALVLVAALADGAAQHTFAYYALLAAVPVAALAALVGLGAVLDGTAAEPLDRAAVALFGLALPMLLLATAIRAPLLGADSPPRLGMTAVVACLVLFALQAALSAAALLSDSTGAALERQ